MKLREIILSNFRPYGPECRIQVDDFTALIGRNDIGKSCILEALEIFFNNDVVKLDIDDLTRGANPPRISIGCVFDDLPSEIVLDAQARTTLEQERLLNADGRLEIWKVFECGGGRLARKEDVYARAMHPTAPEVRDLLQLKVTELREKIQELGIDPAGIDLRSNPDMRRAIWGHVAALNIQPIDVSLDEEDAKRIWERLQAQLPIFALFKADRASRDDDSEFQDPMKLAIKEALAAQAPALNALKDAVRQTALETANRTLDKLKEIDPSLATRLEPNFRTEPKWDSVFKLNLESDDGIPMNKRGSGVRRLILLNFFRAEAERRLSESAASNGIIYAIEEPETSQHPSFQKLLVRALQDIAATGHHQVLITTHNPAIAALVPIGSVRHVVRRGGQMAIEQAADDVWASIADELGVLPDSRVQAIVCVEGPNDVNALGHFSRILNAADNTIPSLASARAVAVIPLGGSTLNQWVDQHYLQGLNRPEAHWYDRDADAPPHYQVQADTVNARTDGSFAVLTGKRSLENYLHPDAVQAVYGITVTFGDTDDVPAIVAEAVHTASGPVTLWAALLPERRKEKINRVKRRLNDEVAGSMTVAQLQERDPDRDIERWLRRVATLCQ